jgi:hypothetical protein
VFAAVTTATDARSEDAPLLPRLLHVVSFISANAADARSDDDDAP